MREIYFKFSAIIYTLALLSVPVEGQFYNGHQMTFGKNRVQFNDFYWQYLRFERFDTYFNQDGRELAEYTAEAADKELLRIESFFDYTLDQRIIFLVYNKLTDFRQSNIGLITGKEDYNVGGVTQINKNKVFLYFEGDYEEFDEQIASAITKVVLNEMLFGSAIRENITNSTLISLPDWYTKGLISYVSNNWDIEIENRVKDGILSEKYEKFSRLTGEDAVYAGHSFWRYIAKTYGESVIPNIIYLTRINKNTNYGFLYVLGLSIKDLSYEWLGYYINEFSEEEELPAMPENGRMLKKPRKYRVYYNIEVSPTGTYIAYVTNNDGKYKIWLFNTNTGKFKRIFKRGHKLEQITDYSYPVLAWHPSGRILSFITEEKGGLDLYYYTPYNDELEQRNLLYYDKILDFNFSHDGLKYVFSAVKDGQSDIYVHTIASATNEQITNDKADDFQPRFINNSEQIIFSSNRLGDTIHFENSTDLRANTHDLFIYDYKSGSNVLMRVKDKPYSNNYQPMEYNSNEFVHLGDANGIKNRYYSKFDSTISFIDTTTHYRYFTQSYPLTNYSRNILEHDYNAAAGKVAEIFYKDGRHHLYQYEINTNEKVSEEEIIVTEYKKNKIDKLAEEDSLNRLQKQTIALKDVEDNQIVVNQKDTVELDEYEIDVNNYVFEREKLNFYNDKFKRDNISLAIDTALNEETKRPRIYQTAFYTNFLVNQVDFNFLNESYQAFTGGAFYFNPGFNLLFKLGTNDLFENYKITGGYRFSGDFDANEYLLSFENLKNRLNKQLIFHRQAFKNVIQDESDNPLRVKIHTHELMGVLRWPFSQVDAIKGTLTLRHDRTAYLANPYQIRNLDRANEHKLWVGVKGEYIFDNTRSLGKNLWSGTRYKVFAEAYKQVNLVKDDLFVLGGDFRHYLRIHRNLIWANRFAASTTFGSSRLIYYLGGVDNWTNLSSRTPTFIPFSEIPIDYEQNYVYQAVATNMRGFSQNIRNGNNFALVNSEIRWPIIKYFVNHPMSSSFLENFQVVGFFDIGSAWKGLHPYAGENAYDNKEYEYNSLKIIIDANREPVVAGYGVGVRTQLLGYFMRFDWAWGIENRTILPHVFYFSLSTDF